MALPLGHDETFTASPAPKADNGSVCFVKCPYLVFVYFFRFQLSVAEKATAAARMG